MDDIPADDFPNEDEQEVADTLYDLALPVGLRVLKAVAQAQDVPVEVPALNAPQAIPVEVPALNAPQAIIPVDVPALNAQAQAVPIGVPPALNAQPQAIPLDVPGAFRCCCRHMNNRCSLMGCSMRASSDLYCCTDHRHIAEANSKRSYAFHYFDGFRSEEEQHACSLVAITKAMDGLNVGIPTFDINVLLLPPWNQTSKFFTDLKTHWFFFMKDFKRMPRMHGLSKDRVYIAWSRTTLRYLVGNDVPAQNVATVLPYNLEIIIICPEEIRKEQEQLLRVQDWYLYQYRLNQSNSLSLFCMTKVRSDIKDPIVKGTTVKPQKEEVEGDAGGEKKEVEGDAGREKKASRESKRAKKNDAAGSDSVPVSQHTYKNDVVDSHDLPLNVDVKRGDTESRWYSSLTNGKCRKSESLAPLSMKSNWFMGYQYESTAAAAASSTQAPPPPAEKFEYQAKVSRLMDLIVNSLYSNKKVFLRELISNASDALDTLLYLSDTNPDLSKDAADPDIRICADKENGVITLTDSGIGMTRQELVDCLGTIAQSGTAKFLKALKNNKDAGGDNNLIGQFGVGFYSAFLLSDRVTSRGTHITLHLKVRIMKKALDMERLMKAQSAGDTTSLKFMKGRRVLEINPDHSIIKNINPAYKSNPNDEEAMKAIDLMYGAALVSSGFTPENPAELGGKIYEMMDTALSGKWSSPEAQPQQHMAQTHNAELLEAKVVEPVEVDGKK